MLAWKWPLSYAPLIWKWHLADRKPTFLFPLPEHHEPVKNCSTVWWSLGSQRALLSQAGTPEMVPSAIEAMHSQHSPAGTEVAFANTSPVSVTPSHTLRSSAWPLSQKWSQLFSWPPQNCLPVQPWHSFPIFHSTRFTFKCGLLAFGIIVWWKQGRTKMEWCLFRAVKWVENYQKEKKIEMKLPMIQFPWQLPFHLQFLSIFFRQPFQELQGTTQQLHISYF